MIRPGVILLLRRVAAARARGRRPGRGCGTCSLTGDAPSWICCWVSDAYLGRTPLAWLGVGPTSSSPAAVKSELEKLAFLRRLDA
nr:hypothetical protein [Actinoplanes globisporus]